MRIIVSMMNGRGITTITTLAMKKRGGGRWGGEDGEGKMGGEDGRGRDGGERGWTGGRKEEGGKWGRVLFCSF
jgi:hypothetical protein